MLPPARGGTLHGVGFSSVSVRDNLLRCVTTAAASSQDIGNNRIDLELTRQRRLRVTPVPRVERLHERERFGDPLFLGVNRQRGSHVTTICR